MGVDGINLLIMIVILQIYGDYFHIILLLSSPRNYKSGTFLCGYGDYFMSSQSIYGNKVRNFILFLSKFLKDRYAA